MSFLDNIICYNNEWYEWFLFFVIIIWLFLSVIYPRIFFKNLYKSGELTFFYNNPEKYGIQTEKQLNDFFRFCDELSKETVNNPFYCKKPVKIYICSSYKLFAFFNPFVAVKAIGHNLTLFNYSRIVLTKTNLADFILTSPAKRNNKSDLKSVMIHELTHAYRTKTMTFLLFLFSSIWKEEGICEVVASDSTYNIDEGIERLISKSPDNSNSYKYFTYRMCVLYLMKHDGLSFKEVIKDKRKKKEILSELYSLPETELKKLLE